MSLLEKCLTAWFVSVFTFQVVWVHLYQQTGSQARAGRGPNLMPTSFKTLRYLPSLKNVELSFLKKWRFLALI